MSVASVHRRTLAKRRRCGLGLRSRFVAAEKRLVRASTDDDGGGLIDPPDREHRVDNQVARASGGESPPPPIGPLLQSRFTRFACRGATSRRPKARPVSRRTVCEVTTVWLGRSDWSRRDMRQRVKRLASGPIGGGGDSPVTHRASSYRHDCAQSRGSHQPPPSSVIRARRAVFPRRRPGVKSPPHRRRFASVRR